MHRVLLTALSIFLLCGNAHSKLMINEFVTGTGSDWVELFFSSNIKEKKDVSGLYVTMYYGENEPLGKEPITIYSYDRPETPYDDRFIVVHLTENLPDETDRTGDTNHNGCIDVYCRNYVNSLWNTEGVVAIDTDDDPSNGGIIDFVAYSNYDGIPNTVIGSYTLEAQKQKEWQACTGPVVQACSVFIGKTGLPRTMSVSRLPGPDTNSKSDFQITTFQTPGRPNVTSLVYFGKKLIRPLRKTVTIIPNHPVFGSGEIPVLVLQECDIKYRIFSSTGIVAFDPPPIIAARPGLLNLSWNTFFIRSGIPTGLYICKIDAKSSLLKKSETKKIFIVLSRYR